MDHRWSDMVHIWPCKGECVFLCRIPGRNRVRCQCVWLWQTVRPRTTTSNGAAILSNLLGLESYFGTTDARRLMHCVYSRRACIVSNVLKRGAQCRCTDIYDTANPKSMQSKASPFAAAFLRRDSKFQNIPARSKFVRQVLRFETSKPEPRSWDKVQNPERPTHKHDSKTKIWIPNGQAINMIWDKLYNGGRADGRTGGRSGARAGGRARPMIIGHVLWS